MHIFCFYRHKTSNGYLKQGHDTTTSAICFALYNLAKYPEAQKKVFDEVTAVFANHEGVPTLRYVFCSYLYLCKY